MVAAASQGITRPQLAERFALPPGRIPAILARHDITGGPLVRQLRAQLPRLDESRLSARQRDVIDLVIVQRLTQPEAAARLGVSRTTIFKELKALAERLPRDGE